MEKPNIQGHRIEAVRRVLYAHHDDSRDQDMGGPIEFRLDDGRVFWLDSGADGESIKTTWEPWSDPFEEPLTEANRRFVGRAGKWAAHNVGDQLPYSRVVGATVRDVSLRTATDGKVTGVTIHTDDGVVGCAVEADELYVDLA